MRKLKEIVEDYKSLLLIKDSILRIMDDQNYEFGTMLSQTNQGCQLKCENIDDIRANIEYCLSDLVETEKASSLLKFNMKKWGRENNPWENSNPQTIAGVFESACATQNLMKFEIALTSLYATGGDAEKKKKITDKGFANIQSGTKNTDNQIFCSALLLAQVDEGKTPAKSLKDRNGK